MRIIKMLMNQLEANNWNGKLNKFHIFNSPSELYHYIHRSNEGIWWREEYGRLDFEQCEFNFDVTQWYNTFSEDAWFKHATFNGKVSFKGLTLKKIANFNGCRFKNDASFQEVKFEGDVMMSSFDRNVNFHKTQFNSDSFFWDQFRGECDFSHSKFKNSADFSDCVFHNDVKFHNSLFESEAYFNNSEFKGKVNAWKMTFRKSVTFKWTDFREKANFSQLSAEMGGVEFHGSNFEKNAYFYDNKIMQIDLEKSVIDKNLFFLGSEIKNAKRETFRIIKNELLKQNNKIESLKFHARELEEYEKELFGEKTTIDYSFFRFIRDFAYIFKKQNKSDKFILFFNRISNGYNTRPFRSIGFTLSMTFLFYLIFIYSIKIENGIEFHYSLEYIGLNVKQIFQMLNITNWNYYPFGYDYTWPYGILFIGRVIIGYGFYQTVQAFRKFGKL